jgi:Fusaric acid resistance protein-like
VLGIPLGDRLRRLPPSSAAALRSIFTVPPGRPDGVLGTIIALAVFAPLAVGQGSDRPADGTIAALGALNAVLVPPGGAERSRLSGIAGAAVLNAGALAVGSLVADPLWLTVVAVAMFLPAVSLARAVAPWAPPLSFVAALMFLIGAGLPEGDAGDRFLAALAGGGWALVVAAALAAVGLTPHASRVAAAPPGMRIGHALRFGLATAGALALAAALGLERGYWLGMTIAVVLHPALDPTLERTAHRIVGTLGGAVIGAAIIASVDGPWALIVLITALLGLTGALLGYHYALGVVALTAGVLALLDLGHPGSFALVDERIANTLLGAAVAVLVLLLWPRRSTPAAASAPQPA